MKVLLLTPPLIQVNTPYPATTCLLGFLRQQMPWVSSLQADLGIELVLELFSRDGLAKIEAELRRKKKLAPAPRFFFRHYQQYLDAIDATVRFLQGRDPAAALRIVTRQFLPEGPSFKNLRSHPEYFDEALGHLSITDRARHLASLFMDDLALVLRQGIDPHFEFSKYGERLALAAPSFRPLRTALEKCSTLVDEILSQKTRDLLHTRHPDLVALTVPFPGNLYGALRIAKTIRQVAPRTQVVLGGGYVNTELRSLSDPAIFDYVDFICYDDGEKPLQCLIEHLEGKRPRSDLFRTKFREQNTVKDCSSSSESDIPFKTSATPCYEGLDFSRYLGMFEMLNPVQRLWSGYPWLKLTLAHGCYWRKCTFCDLSIDYINRYEPQTTNAILDKMKELCKTTGLSGFHFVDEAAPPALLKTLSEAILRESLTFTWWGNIRFEKTFTPALTKLMAKAGCVAVTGGIEVASPRILNLINKGVTLDQVARVTRAFANAEIFVHAYLMYGFPSQTRQETIDSLEVVRQLFEAGFIQSAFWHRLSVTAHSPIGLHPEKFGITLKNPRGGSRAEIFAHNDLAFKDPVGANQDEFSPGLKNATYNYMLGLGLENDVREWFATKMPKTTIKRNFVRGL